MHGENWVDKEFELGLPLEQLPALIEQLRSLPGELERTVADVPDGVLRAQPDGTWSVKQQIGHLADLEELHDGRLNDFEARLDTLRAADMTNRKTEEANHNDADINDLLAALRTVRSNFVQRLEGMSEEVQAHSAMHPRLQKPMRLVDLAFFVAEHDAHHVVTIKWMCEPKP